MNKKRYFQKPQIVQVSGYDNLYQNITGGLGRSGANTIPGKTYLVIYVREGSQNIYVESGGDVLKAKQINGYTDGIYICIVRATSSFVKFSGFDNPCVWCQLDE